MRSHYWDEAEHRVVMAPGGNTLRVVLRGQGPPLLMINGIGGHIDMWGPVAELLARTHRLVLFDAPGAGASSPTRKPLRMSGLASMVVQLLDALDIQRVDLLGYSWGGALAQQFAHDWPDRVGQMILVATLPGVGSRPPKLRVVAAMLKPDRYRSSERSRLLAATLYGGDYRSIAGRPSRSLPSAWHDHPPTARGYAQQLYAILGWSSLPWLRRITQPTLIISGGEDPLVPRVNARMLACLIPRAELKLISEGGHLWLLDHPVQSVELIERFLDG